MQQQPSFSTPKSDLDRLTIFTFLWAVVRFFHQISFPEWYYEREWEGVLVMLVLVLCLVRPQSLTLLIALLTTSLVRTFIWMPFNPNHILFEWVVDAAILICILFAIVQNRNRKNELAFRNDLFDSFAPIARISICILYFFGVFHKLNTDYLKIPISCGAVLLQEIADRMYPMVVGDVPKLIAMWGTLIIESLIPVLLIGKKTRKWGILLGLVFHFMLSFHPHRGIYSFSSLMLGYFSLFLPQNAPLLLKESYLSFKARYRLLPGWQRWLIGLGIPTGFVAYLGYMRMHATNGYENVMQIGFVLWCAWAIVTLLVYMLVFIPAKWEFTPSFFKLPSRWAIIVFLLLLLNSLSPYLGFKTQTSFSMFSNLRTEGGKTNHILMPNAIVTHQWQDNLVQITRTDAPNLRDFADGRRMLTYFELHRLASVNQQDFFVEYQQGNQSKKLIVKNGVSSDPELTTPLSLLNYKFIRFRPVFKDTCYCQH
ncbi:HTTM domain-containing protein [Cytophagaceae bacterium YF14B1]|uniref:HTTM domain-containing protein n=1 Tax=Xanthocytophaga flava TaxID=3048013 RepID=A0AAE3QXC3_9BACT|nr:HTTM domain-containing protein [Xanthocytophaga flavus]MDJ1484946.1 HTTM domain-containing protein [Xanthocytophaga flavus]